MELQHLRYFCKIAELESITRASEELYISQPSLSRTLKSLEDEIGIPLFDRTSKGMQLTKEGQTFHQEIRQALSIIDNVKSKMAGKKPAENRELKVALVTTSNAVIYALKMYRKLFPEVKLTFTRPADIINLQPRNFDVLISAAPLNYSGLRHRMLYSEELVLLLSAEHPLAGAGSVDLRELCSDEFILPTSGSPTRLACESLCNYAGFLPRVVASTNNFVSTITYVKAGNGVAIVPFFGITEKLPEDVRMLHIRTPSPHREISISIPENRPFTGLTESFFLFMLDYFGSPQRRNESR